MIDKPTEEELDAHNCYSDENAAWGDDGYVCRVCGKQIRSLHQIEAEAEMDVDEDEDFELF